MDAVGDRLRTAPCLNETRLYIAIILTLFGHAHIWKFFLQFDDEHPEAVGDAAAYNRDDEHGQTDEPALEVGAHDLRDLHVLVLRLLPRVLTALRPPGGHHAHRFRYEAHRGDQSVTPGLLRMLSHLPISLPIPLYDPLLRPVPQHKQ